MHISRYGGDMSSSQVSPVSNEATSPSSKRFVVSGMTSPEGTSSSLTAWTSPSPSKTYNSQRSPTKRTRVDEDKEKVEENEVAVLRLNRPLFDSSSSREELAASLLGVSQRDEDGSGSVGSAVNRAGEEGVGSSGSSGSSGISGMSGSNGSNGSNGSGTIKNGNTMGETTDDISISTVADTDKEADDANSLSTLLDLTDEDVMSMELDMARLTLKSAVRQLRSTKESADKMKSLVSQLELQNKLLTIENHESAQRYEVENNIVKREVDRLRLDASTPSYGLSDAEVYRRRLQKAKLKLREACKEIEEREAENDKLRKRLKDGRLHREAMAAAAARDHQQHQSQHHSNNSQGPSAHSSSRHSHHDSESGLAALGMLASQVLSQQASPHKGLMSPVEFEGSPEKRRRASSASTITIPSEDEEDDDDDVDDVDDDDNDEEDDANDVNEYRDNNNDGNDGNSNHNDIKNKSKTNYSPNMDDKANTDAGDKDTAKIYKKNNSNQAASASSSLKSSPRKSPRKASQKSIQGSPKKLKSHENAGKLSAAAKVLF